MSLNSHWIQKYKPSKLSNRKKRPFYSKMDVFFNRSNLTARKAQTTCTTYTTDTSFESPDIQFLGARRTEGVAHKQSQPAPLSEIN